jgi:hypothetical protein
MSGEIWTSESVEIAPMVFVDVKANEKGIVLGQGNHVWFHNLHITDVMADIIADILKQGAAKHRDMKACCGPAE